MQQTVEALVGRMRTDPEFASKYLNLRSLDAIQAQAKQDGIDVSTDDIKAVIAALGSSRELNENDLSTVAGGGFATKPSSSA